VLDMNNFASVSRISRFRYQPQGVNPRERVIDVSVGAQAAVEADRVRREIGGSERVVIAVAVVIKA